MNNVQQVNFFKAESIGALPLEGGVSISSAPGVKSFKDMMGDVMAEMNEITNKPEKLTQDMMLGKADVHDVMAAIAQSELTVQMATTMTGKILQTYEKIMQIQI